MLFPSFFNAGKPTYEIEQSLRFDGSSRFNQTYASSGNRKTFTISFWVKNTTTTIGNVFVQARTNLRLNTTNAAFIVNAGYGGTNNFLISNASFRDSSAWYHFVLAFDTTQSTASDRVKVWVNNQLQTYSSASYPPQNQDLDYNSTEVAYIGAENTSEYLNGYLAEYHSIDGSALTPTDFGEYDNNGVWRPKRYTGSYGTNGFYLKFDPSATNGIGHDHSGNGNNWTPTGFDTTNSTASTYDVMSDTPTTNYCTWNPIGRGPGVYAPRELHNGNLEILYKRTGIGDWFATTTWCFPQSGNFYWEVTVLATSSFFMLLGIAEQDWTWNTSPTVRYISSDGKISNHVSNAQANPNYTGATYGLNDVIGMAWNGSNNTLQFYKNGVAQGSPLSPTATEGRTFCPIFHAASDNWRVALNAGQRAFAYTPPTGFKALNTSNLPAPTIKDGSDYFDTLLYTGTGGTKAVSGAGFQPEFVWIKNRSRASSSHVLVDAVRGATKALSSNLQSAEVTTNGTDDFRSFDSDGFTVGDSSNYFVNSVGDTHAAWCWDAGGSGSSNTDGTITSTVSANPSAGFSIVSYTGDGVNGATWGHGLGVAPDMVIVKRRNASYNWAVYHSGIDATAPEDYWLLLDGTNARVPNTTIWGSTAPTSTTVKVGWLNETNALNGTYVAYCFAEVEGYSKFGSYIGNGSTDGPFIYTGFKPAWVMIKGNNSSSWSIIDTTRNPYNLANSFLLADSAGSEVTPGYFRDYLSNGIKIRDNGSGVNTSGNTYIFMALAENPFGGDGVSPATAR